jgi:hypothetical protein
MKLDVRAYGIAAGVTAAVVFILCALALVVAPGATTAMFGYMLHLDLSAMQRTLTFGSFLGALIAWTLGTGLTFAFAAAVYNRIIGAAVVQAAPDQRPATQRA